MVANRSYAWLVLSVLASCGEADAPQPPVVVGSVTVQDSWSALDGASVEDVGLTSDGGVVATVDHEREIYPIAELTKLDRAGNLQWTVSYDTVLNGTGCFESLCYSSRRDGYLDAIDADDGSLAWQADLNEGRWGGLYGPVAVSPIDGTVCVNAEETVRCLSTTGVEVAAFYPMRPTIGHSFAGSSFADDGSLVAALYEAAMGATIVGRTPYGEEWSAQVSNRASSGVSAAQRGGGGFAALEETRLVGASTFERTGRWSVVGVSAAGVEWEKELGIFPEPVDIVLRVGQESLFVITDAGSGQAAVLREYDSEGHLLERIERDEICVGSLIADVDGVFLGCRHGGRLTILDHDGELLYTDNGVTTVWDIEKVGSSLYLATSTGLLAKQIVH